MCNVLGTAHVGYCWGAVPIVVLCSPFGPGDLASGINSLSPRPCLTLATGGFNKFQTEYSEHCETNVDSSSSLSGSPPTSVLGLGGLRISSDCSDGESDQELPRGATESDGSQPTFPVQILLNLFKCCGEFTCK